MPKMIDIVAKTTEERYEKDRLQALLASRAGWAERELLTAVDSYFTRDFLDDKFGKFEAASYVCTKRGIRNNGICYTDICSKYHIKELFSTDAVHNPVALYICPREHLIDGERVYQMSSIECCVKGTKLRFCVWVGSTPATGYALIFGAWNKAKTNPSSIKLHYANLPDGDNIKCLDAWAQDKVDRAFTAWYENNDPGDEYFDFTEYMEEA